MNAKLKDVLYMSVTVILSIVLTIAAFIVFTGLYYTLTSKS